MSDRTRDIITLDSLLDEIEQVRQMALTDDDYKTALSCTMSKSKLLGGGIRLEYREKDRNDPLTKMLAM
ncbi:hypothetical protein FHS24_002169 [Psychrobacter luti]|uniref:Uncharacterized protein n=1 Tax=Psychrobacter luti TaxID=198481 RepID=A0A839TEK5_9GAMM|nr:hypothetical protein [Psychrobacter luti]MBB3107638.1 hypothetical protein [Psychrobacter luti]